MAIETEKSVQLANEVMGEVRIADSVVANIALLAAKETDGAFNKTNLESDIDYNYNEGDPVGPFDVGMTVTKGDSDGSLGL